MYWERAKRNTHVSMVQRKWQQEEQKPQTQLFDLTLLSTLYGKYNFFTMRATTTYIMPSGLVMETKQNKSPDQGRIDGSSSSRSNRYIPIDSRKIYKEFSKPEADQITIVVTEPIKEVQAVHIFEVSIFLDVRFLYHSRGDAPNRRKCSQTKKTDLKFYSIQMEKNQRSRKKSYQKCPKGIGKPSTLSPPG